MLKIDQIEDVIARDTWTSHSEDGQVITHEIIVGRPFPAPGRNDEWICPVSIEHFTSRIVPAFGVGPVDSLMNAMVLVREFFNKINRN